MNEYSRFDFYSYDDFYSYPYDFFYSHSPTIIIPNTSRAVQLWTRHTSKPLFIGLGSLSNAIRENLCCQQTRCYVIEYHENIYGLGADLIDFGYYGKTIDEIFIDVYVNGSNLSAKYPFMNNFTLAQVSLELTETKFSFDKEFPTRIWKGEFDNYLTVDELERIKYVESINRST